MIQQIHFWRYTPKGLKIGLRRDICPFMFIAAFIHNSQKMEATQVTIYE